MDGKIRQISEKIGGEVIFGGDGWIVVSSNKRVEIRSLNDYYFPCVTKTFKESMGWAGFSKKV